MDQVLTAGGAIFRRLKQLGVNYIFVNSGTDFPPIIEGLAQAGSDGATVPYAIVIPHENAAMGMAHGYYLISGEPQAVMLHTNVGLSNGATGAINAACDNVPTLIMSGRTPVTEKDRFGARTVPIGWGQEMRDQTALVREVVKWDYELKFPEQIVELIDRGHAIATSTPKGPIYISLPRETLCEELASDHLDLPLTMRGVDGAPNLDQIEELAQMIAAAKSPLLIAQRGAGDQESFDLFADLALEWGVPVCSWWATQLAIATDHPCHIGAEPSPWIEKADLVIVLDSLAPWWPDRHQVQKHAKIVHLGPDPLFARYPVRNFRADMSIAGETKNIIAALSKALARQKKNAKQIELRSTKVHDFAQARLKENKDIACRQNEVGITKAWVGDCLSKAIQNRKSTVFSELGVPLSSLHLSQKGSWFQEPFSGGLGWGFPAALGAQLAEPDRLCVATMGDGSYMFSNPTVCHQIAEALELPLLVIVLNNEEWGAVRQSVAAMYPDGAAAKTNRMPLTSLTPSPDFCKTAQASRAWTKSVTQVEDVFPAICEAINVIDNEGRLAFLDIKILAE